MFRKLYIKWLVWRGKAVNISSNGDYPGGMLSNFTPYEFTYRGFKCVSMEGVLQGLKFEGAEKQARIFQMVGKDAKYKGKKRKWWLDQKLYWQGRSMDRQSDEFKAIVREAFDALSANEDFQKTLLTTGNKRLFHSMGKTDPTKTILTEEEFCTILTELRAKLQNERL